MSGGPTQEEWATLLPEMLLLAGAVCGLLLGLWTPQRRQGRVAVVAGVALLASGAAAVAGDDRVVFDGVWTVDATTRVVRLGVVVATAGFVALARARFSGHRRETEAYVLALLGAVGANALAAASDLLLLVAAYLVASVPLYALVGFVQDARGAEATLKYYLMGALSGVVLLVGVATLLLATGSTGYAEVRAAAPTAPSAVVAVGVLGVLTGVLFKAGAVPVHFWVPDVTAGTAPAVAAYVTTVPKLGAVAAAFRLLADPLSGSPVDVVLVVAVVATASMTLGNLAAFRQQELLRLLAYSTVSQVGYLLMAVAVAARSQIAEPSLVTYLVAYAVTNVAAFSAAATFPGARTLGEWTTTATRHPWVVVSLVVALLGLVGTPPTAVFVGKLAVFTAAGDGGLGWLVVVGALNTVASLFYYLRWIAPAARAVTDRSPGVAGQRPRTAGPAEGVLHVGAVATVVVGLVAGLLVGTGAVL
ncbi:NADH-quinone oxidoreductase subunit N [Thalassiella azotivora]